MVATRIEKNASLSGELPSGVSIRAPLLPGMEEILTHDALAFIADLARQFGPRVEALLERRTRQQKRLDRGETLGFLEDTRGVRESDWRVAPIPDDLLDRRVEITGPTDAKMIINALNSGANVFMADLEDAGCPTWENVVIGQKNLKDAVRKTLTFEDKERGKHYALFEKTAVLMVRPRGWHLYEEHVFVDGRPVPGGLFDFGLYFFHNARALIEQKSGPYFYLPKLEGHLEAKLWNDVFTFSEKALGIAMGTIKATVLIETLPAAFEMDEILYALKEHSAGLNCGRWDYIFSFIKKHRADPTAVLPDRDQVGMTQPFMRAYTQLVIKTCHRRGAFAMGGMAAQIPIKDDPAKNEEALAKVRTDKEREAKDGHDGTWVAHPGLVPVAKAVFDRVLGERKNQLEVKRDDVHVRAEDLLEIPEGTITEAGVRKNIRVGVQYLEAWLRGSGCVPLYSLMEDAATAEISRTQLWQWLHHRAVLDDGRILDEHLFDTLFAEEMSGLRKALGDHAFSTGAFQDASTLFVDLVKQDRLVEFLTLPAYQHLLKQGR